MQPSAGWWITSGDTQTLTPGFGTIEGRSPAATIGSSYGCSTTCAGTEMLETAKPPHGISMTMTIWKQPSAKVGKFGGAFTPPPAFPEPKKRRNCHANNSQTGQSSPSVNGTTGHTSAYYDAAREMYRR